MAGKIVLLMVAVLGVGALGKSKDCPDLFRKHHTYNMDKIKGRWYALKHSSETSDGDCVQTLVDVAKPQLNITKISFLPKISSYYVLKSSTHYRSIPRENEYGVQVASLDSMRIRVPIKPLKNNTTSDICFEGIYVKENFLVAYYRVLDKFDKKKDDGVVVFGRSPNSATVIRKEHIPGIDSAFTNLRLPYTYRTLKNVTQNCGEINCDLKKLKCERIQNKSKPSTEAPKKSKTTTEAPKKSKTTTEASKTTDYKAFQKLFEYRD